MYIVKGTIHIDKDKGGKSKEGRYIVSRLEMIAEDYKEANEIRKKFKEWLEKKNKKIGGEIGYSIECLEDVGKEREVGESIRRKVSSGGRIIDSNF